MTDMRISKANKTGIVAISLVVALSIALIYSFAITSHEILSRSYQSNQTSHLFVLGDVLPVLNGDLDYRRYLVQDTSSVAFALGAGALGSVDRTGELLVFDGKAYIKSCDPKANYMMEISTEILTPFCFGLEKGSRPSAIYTLEGRDERGYALNSIYEKLSEEHGRIFAVVGVAEFAEIQRSAIKLAPIYGESIVAQANREKYFHDLPPIKDVVSIFFGTVSNPNKAAAPGYDLGMEERIFYTNPAEKGASTLQSHTHILITARKSLEGKLDDSDDEISRFAKSLSVIDINHLLTQSTVRKATIMIYDIRAMIGVAGTSAARGNSEYLLPTENPMTGISQYGTLEAFVVATRCIDY